MPLLRIELVTLGGARGRLGGQIDVREPVPLAATTLVVTASATAPGDQPTVPSDQGTVFADLTATDGFVYVASAVTPDPTIEPRLLVGPNGPQRLHVRPGHRIAAVMAATVPGPLVAVASNRQAEAANRSGTIAGGGVAQDLMGDNAARRGWEIQNQSFGRLWVRSKGSTGALAAGADQNAILLEAGDYYSPPHVTTNALSILGPTTGQAFYAREW